MNKIVEIAKANGAQVVIDLHTEDIAFTASQLRATIEQVCAPVVEALEGMNAIYDTDGDHSIADGEHQRDKSTRAIAAYRALIGDKHE